MNQNKCNKCNYRKCDKIATIQFESEEKENGFGFCEKHFMKLFKKSIYIKLSK